jgi:hypothetical protein
MQCFVSAEWICRDCSATCVVCKNALDKEHAKTVCVNGIKEDLCPACVKAHRCQEWLIDAGGGYEYPGTGESFWREGYRCAVCGANLSVRDLEAA